MQKQTIIGITAILLIAFSGTVWASDGCVEISAVNVATAGTITAPGCYVLTSDLAQGIVVNAPNVTVDLNGFSIAPTTGPAVYLSGPRDNIEIRNGTVWSPDAPAIDAGGVMAGTNHVYRDLRVVSDAAAGILYSLPGGTLENIQLENVVIRSIANGVEIGATAGDNVLRHLRIHRCEIRGELMSGIAILGPNSVNSFRVYGFELESSTVASANGLAAVFIDTASVSGSDPWNAEFSGGIRHCELSAPGTGGMAVVYLNARAGTLHCSYNNLIAENLMAGTPNEYAFSAPSGADITILYNTSAALGGSPAVPISGSIVSPNIGHDGSNYLSSNTDFYVGSY